MRIRLVLIIGVALLGAADAAAAAPVAGSVFGPVTSVKGSTFTISSKLSPTGSSKATVSGSTTVTTTVNAPRSSLRAGICVMATGTKNSKGVVAATRIQISAPVKGSCTQARGGNRPPGGAPPNGGTAPNRTSTTPRTRPTGGFGRGNGGFAVGGVTKISGNTLTVNHTVNGKKTTSSVTVSSKTILQQTKKVAVSAIKTSMCAFVQGTSADGGKTVNAQQVRLTKKVNGQCASGPRRQG